MDNPLRLARLQQLLLQRPLFRGERVVACGHHLHQAASLPRLWLHWCLLVRRVLGQPTPVELVVPAPRTYRHRSHLHRPRRLLLW